MKVGFIGLGIMGSRMAANLQKHDYEVIIFNRTQDKATSLINNGALWADTPEVVAKQVDIIFTMLANPEAIMNAALGEHGFLDNLAPNSLWVDCSTVNPSFSRQMAMLAQDKQVRFLDAPVAGSKNQAEKAQLVFMVGGDATDVKTCEPLFEAMGSRFIHVGEHGMGTSLKLANNLLLGTTMAAFAEAVTLGEALGISQEMLLNVLLGGAVAAPFLSTKKEMLEQDNYEAEFPLQWMQKDLHMVSIAAHDSGVAVPVTSNVKELYRLAMQQGLGEKDFSAIYSFLKQGF
ncbi:putative 2-hydroxy-3-oxopropionate reductase [Calothrix sp. NIES-4071]|nr:putative 2-hydroxy-3-oxopropionate reductase [Calothrix sp. NIES-4071]BAZ59955.1 putative 2-hydroxy-3-oxopropionate reductase [Calothrix sp. NIES-4105]